VKYGNSSYLVLYVRTLSCFILKRHVLLSVEMSTNLQELEARVQSCVHMAPRPQTCYISVNIVQKTYFYSALKLGQTKSRYNVSPIIWFTLSLSQNVNEMTS